MFHVTKIHAWNFMGHEDSCLELPPAGVVTVSGLNGHGKTAITIEAVGTAIYGETLRKKPPWMGEKSRVLVETDKVRVDVSKTQSGSPTLKWNHHGEEAVDYGTPTKARAALNKITGDFDTWKRTCVLTLKEGQGFASVSDKVRKELFEKYAGIESFDPALEKCRKDLAESEKVLKETKAKLALVLERIRGAKARLDDLEETEAAEQAVVGKALSAAAKLAAQKDLAAAQAQEKEYEQKLRAAEREAAKADADLGVAEQACKRLDKDNCPTCGQDIPKKMREDLHDKVLAAKAHREGVCVTNKTKTAEYTEAIELARDEVAELRQLLERDAKTARDAAQVAKNAEQRLKKEKEIRAELKLEESKRADLESRVTALQADVQELQYVERTLSPKGARVALIEAAMAAVEMRANNWLSRLFPGASVRLYIEDSKIQLDILGVKHPHGYDGCSSGQKRRIDVAFVFAFNGLDADVLDGTGTMFLDEVADSLDEEGLALFADAITQIAKDRCVVLITHNKNLLSGIRAVRRFHVVDGKVVTQ